MNLVAVILPPDIKLFTYKAKGKGYMLEGSVLFPTHKHTVPKEQCTECALSNVNVCNTAIYLI